MGLDYVYSPDDMSLESIGGMILTGKYRRTRRKVCPSMQFLLIIQLQYLQKCLYISHTTLAKYVITKSENIRYKNQEESIILRAAEGKSFCHLLYVTFRNANHSVSAETLLQSGKN
jgi:hypothetical protein